MKQVGTGQAGRSAANTGTSPRRGTDSRHAEAAAALLAQVRPGKELRRSGNFHRAQRWPQRHQQCRV